MPLNALSERFYDRELENDLDPSLKFPEFDPKAGRQKLTRCSGTEPMSTNIGK